MSDDELAAKRELVILLGASLKKAEEQRDGLTAAIRLCAAWMSDPDENPLERFERIADDYYADTGFLRPGKSEPMECGRDSGDEENQKRWTNWVKERSRRVMAVARAALAKAEK